MAKKKRRPEPGRRPPRIDVPAEMAARSVSQGIAAYNAKMNEVVSCHGRKCYTKLPRSLMIEMGQVYYCSDCAEKGQETGYY